MKAIHLIKTLLLLALVATVSVRCECNKTTVQVVSAAEKLNAKWTLTAATLNGAAIPNAGGTGYSMTLTQTPGQQGGNYSVTKGTLPFSASLQPSGSGTWVVNAEGTLLTLDNTRPLTLNLSADGKTMEVSWKATTAEDKNLPDVKFIFTKG
jgi:hypothetical protein